MRYNKNQVEKAAPDGMMDLGEGVRPEQVDTFKAYWNQEVAGQGAMAFIGGSKNPKFIPFKGSNRDMQFLEWQIYLVRKIAGVFMLTPQDLGVTFDVRGPGRAIGGPRLAASPRACRVGVYPRDRVGRRLRRP